MRNTLYILITDEFAENSFVEKYAALELVLSDNFIVRIKIMKNQTSII